LNITVTDLPVLKTLAHLEITENGIRNMDEVKGYLPLESEAQVR
jgi:hypothetical protein